MKKTTALLLCVAIAATASAQLKVTSNGQVRVGTESTQSGSSTGVMLPGSGLAGTPDTTANLRIMGSGLQESGGKIAFGGRGHVSIRESETSQFGRGSSGSLLLQGDGGISYTSGENTIFNYNPVLMTIGGGSPFSFNTTVSAPQYLTTSDARCKTDIEPLEDIGSQLRNIVPVSYTLVQETGAENQDAPAGAPRKSGAQQNTQHQYGFLAQDVREVYLELVYEDSEGMLSIDYTGFIPILVDAIQNLQTLSEEQAALISAQAEAIAVLKGEKLPGHDEDSVVASLSQNRPNPFRASTVINCVLPEDVSDAFLCVYDLNGNQKMRRNISGRGSVDITIEGNTLNAGMYIYTLIADGIEIGSKRMILTD